MFPIPPAALLHKYIGQCSRWLTVSPSGAISGTPLITNIGPYSFTVTVTSSTTGLSASDTVTGTVTHSAPTWSQTTITLPDANDANPYTTSISSFAAASDSNDTLAFTLGANAPAWLSISTSGTITASPTIANVGSYTFSAIVTDQAKYTATATIQLKVDHVGPQWTANPVILPNATTGVAYSQGLAGYVTEPVAGDTLTFTMTPTWATLDSKGNITGTPAIPNMGANSWQVTVTDSLQATATTTVQITVGHLPPSWTLNPIVLPDANDATAYSQSVASYASSSDPGDTLTFTAGTNFPAWLSISTTGTITGSPATSNVGSYTFSVTVTDQANATATTNVQLKVDHVGPQWTANPVILPNATTGTLYSQSIASYVNDPHKTDTLTYTMTGPSWATISPTGTISGTPAIANIGVNTFQATVKDSEGATAVTTVQITVGHLPPTWTVNPIVLPDANDATAYSQSVASYAKSSDTGDTLTFTLGANAPTWLAISSTGTITGAPTMANVGSVTFSVIVTDQAGATATTTAQLKVDHVPPQWSANPIILPGATTGAAYRRVFQVT